MTKGSIRIHWGGQIASRNNDEEAGRNWGVLGWLICLPKRTGPDFTGGGCVAGDARSRSVFRERSLAVAWGGREGEELAEPVGGGVPDAFGDGLCRTW